MEQRGSYVLPRASHVYCYLTAELFLWPFSVDQRLRKAKCCPPKHVYDDSNRCSEYGIELQENPCGDSRKHDKRDSYPDL